jgi:hypothetical protein
MDAPTDEIPRAEALLAVVGVDPFFGDGPIRITAPQRHEAERLGVTIRKQLKRFVGGTEWDRSTEMPAFKYRDALHALTGSFDPSRLADKIAKIDPEDSQELLMSAGRAVEYLRNVLPKRSRPTPLGPEPVDPSDADRSAFRRAYAVCNRPLVVLEDLNEGTLARDEMRTLDAVYPGIYEAIKAALFEVLTDYKAAHPKGELAHRRSKQLSVLLLDAGAIDAPLAKVLQQNFAEADESQPQPTPESKPFKSTEDSDLPLRRLENR